MNNELQRQLDGELPDGLEPLADEEAQRLADMIADAKRTQAEAVDKAITDGLSVIPALLRRPVKKVLFS